MIHRWSLDTPPPGAMLFGGGGGSYDATPPPAPVLGSAASSACTPSRCAVLGPPVVSVVGRPMHDTGLPASLVRCHTYAAAPPSAPSPSSPPSSSRPSPFCSLPSSTHPSSSGGEGGSGGGVGGCVLSRSLVEALRRLQVSSSSPDGLGEVGVPTGLPDCGSTSSLDIMGRAAAAAATATTTTPQHQLGGGSFSGQGEADESRFWADTLGRWSLILRRKSLLVTGVSHNNHNTLIESAEITTRIDYLCVQDRNGIVYNLLPNNHDIFSTTLQGLPVNLSSHFASGFPTDWQTLVANYCASLPAPAKPYTKRRRTGQTSTVSPPTTPTHNALQSS